MVGVMAGPENYLSLRLRPEIKFNCRLAYPEGSLYSPQRTDVLTIKLTGDTLLKPNTL